MIETLQALLTPLIAIITTLIAYQQYRIRSDERQLLLYDRRLAIYTRVMGVVDTVRACEPMELKDSFDWLTSVQEAPFLFGEEVQEVIHELYGAVLSWSHQTEPVKMGAREFDIDCASAASFVELFRLPIIEVFSPYLHPTGTPIWKRRRKSLKSMKRRLEAMGIDGTSRQKAEFPEMTSPDDGEDIPF